VSVMPGAEPFFFDGGTTAPAGVILCHGFTGTTASVRAWAEHLGDAGFSVHAPRLPGHGTRWQDLNATRWEDWYGELERAFDAMLDRHPFVVGMGLSMGATLVLRLAQLRGEELAGAVVVNPSLLTLRRDAKLLPVISKFVPSVSGIASDIKRTGVAEVAYTRTPLRAAYSLSNLWRTTRADLARITLPIDLYRSREDHVVEAESSRVLLAGVSSTDVRETILEDSYHVATLDNDAEQIFEGSTAFVRRLLAQRTASGAGGERV
jgi:carboxylesterase